MTRIDGLNSLATSRTGASAGASAVDQSKSRDGSQKTSEAAGPQDQVSLSNRGRIIADAAAAVSSSPDVRQEKVMALKAAIANGSYNPDPRAIAQRLLGSL